MYDAISNSVLEGWKPIRDDVAEQCAATAGRLSIEDIVRRARLDAVRRNKHHKPTWDQS